MTQFIHILLSLTTYSTNLSNISFVWNLMVTVKEWKSECGVSSVCVECVSSHRRWQQGVTLCWSSLSLTLVFSLSQVVSCRLRFLVSLLMTVCHIVMDVSTLHKVSFANRSHSPESSFFLQTYGEFRGFFFYQCIYSQFSSFISRLKNLVSHLILLIFHLLIFFSWSVEVQEVAPCNELFLYLDSNHLFLYKLFKKFKELWCELFQQ